MRAFQQIREAAARRSGSTRRRRSRAVDGEPASRLGRKMTKSELIDAIAGRGELTKARAELVVNCVFDAMTEALQRGEGIEIRGFGSFTVRPYKPYNGRNPRTGQPVPVPAKRLPFFKVGKELKELVNNSRTFAISGGDDGDDDDDDE
jgi:integration host factor subunit beta